MNILINMLQTGDIIFYTRCKYLGKLIKWITRSNVSHCAVVINMNNKSYIAEATENGIELSCLPSLRFTAIIRHKDFFTPTSEQIKQLENKILSKVGIQYDFKGLLIYQVIYQLFGIWLGKRKDSDDAFYCSEFCAWLYDISKWWKYSPDMLLKHNDFIQLNNNI